MKKSKRSKLESECIRFGIYDIYTEYKHKLSHKPNPGIHHLAWVVYSDYLLLSKADENGNCTCVTCGAINERHSPYMHPGHFLEAGKSLKRKYIDDNVRPQCYSCNVARNGNYKQYTLFMLEKFGRDFIDILLRDNDTYKIKNYEYADKIKERYSKILLLTQIKGNHTNTKTMSGEDTKIEVGEVK